MKEFTIDQSGMTTNEGIRVEKSEEIDKSITQYGGDGDWKWLHGTRLLVAKDGIVLKGPDLMIGRKWSDLENLTYHDIFQVERGVMRAIGATNKSYNPDDPNRTIERDAILKETLDDMNKAIEIRKAAKAKLYNNDPINYV